MMLMLELLMMMLLMLMVMTIFHSGTLANTTNLIHNFLDTVYD